VIHLPVRLIHLPLWFHRRSRLVRGRTDWL